MTRLRLMLVAGITALLVAMGAPAAWAWWSDTATSTSTVTAYTVPAPTVSCGALSVGSTTINWSPVSGATGYVVHYGPGGGSTTTVPATTLSQTYSGLIVTGTFWVQAQIDYGSTTWTSVNSRSVSYQVALFLVGSCGLLPLG